LPVWIWLLICAVFPSRIAFESALDPSRISNAGMRPVPTFFKSCCATTARTVSARTMRICSCSLAGKASMIRSTAFAAEFVCSVAKTSSPVSAAVRAIRIVSRSRISPTRRQSGSSRIAAFTPSAKVVTSGPISRWVKIDLSSVCTNSIGSSIVTTCRESLRFTRSRIAASVVDFPLPVGPVTRMSPRPDA